MISFNIGVQGNNEPLLILLVREHFRSYKWALDTRMSSKRESLRNFAQARDLEEDEEALKRWKGAEATWMLPTHSR